MPNSVTVTPFRGPGGALGLRVECEGGHLGFASESGGAYVREPACELVHAVTGALGEWYTADRMHYDGSNARKVRAEMGI